MNSRRIHIEEYDDHLSIEIKWYTPSIFFLLFFTIIWNSFLFFWYSMNTPLVFKVFALGHVAAGIYLSYTVLAGFLNKTFIEIDRDRLTLTTGPIAIKKDLVDIPTDRIQQLYVKKKVTNTDDSISTDYNLIVRLNNGIEKSIGKTGLLSDSEALRLETKIEDFLNIKDEPIKGEFASKKTEKQISSVPPKNQPKKLNTEQLSWLRTRLGQTITYENEPYRVGHKIQHDWKNGESDLQIQGIGNQDESVLFFVKQDKALYQSFIETKLPLGIASRIFFVKSNPSETLQYNNKTYLLTDFKEGKSFVNDQATPISTRQWIYRTEDGEEQLRFVDQKNLMSYYKGIQPSPLAFENDFDEGLNTDYLDLNEPQKQIRPNYNEEDLV